MGAWEDFSKFLENRLEDFLDSNPRLKQLVELESIRQQQLEAEQQLRQFHSEIERLQEEIVSVAREVQKWQERVTQAETGGRKDLADAARVRSSECLRQGNALWGQMKVLQQQQQQTSQLLERIAAERRRLEVEVAQQEQTSARASTAGTTGSSAEELEKRFRDWELQQELDRLKRNQS